ncbi:MAG: monovalent cation/H(+) antiporter subunit G, partial [Acidobacteria bacterium]|nr:monovalent cation/H(+) antiporter subunit G [Acidobacteriota bacterium]
RFPDVCARFRAAGKCDSLESLRVLTGLACHEGFALVSAKLLIVAAFILVTSPTATHAIARAARRNRLESWTGEGDG